MEYNKNQSNKTSCLVRAIRRVHLTLAKSKLVYTLLY